VNPDKVQKAVEQALAMISNVQAEFREVAFQEVFSRLLDESGSLSQQMLPAKQATDAVNEGNRTEVLKAILEAEIDISPYHELLDNGSWVDRVILLLWIIENQLSIKTLTPPEMAEIFTDKFRKAKVYAPNIGRAITNSMEFFIRSPEGNAYKYGLSSKGIERVAEITK
jgi:hypothetical protein